MSFRLRLHGGPCEQYDLGAQIGASRQCGFVRETLLDVTSCFPVDDRRHILEGLSEGVAVAATEKGNGSKESGHAQELQERVVRRMRQCLVKMGSRSGFLMASANCIRDRERETLLIIEHHDVTDTNRENERDHHILGLLDCEQRSELCWVWHEE